MRNITLIFLAIAVLMPLPAMAQAKLIVDPNTQTSIVADYSNRVDPRLAQKVDYLSGYKRLHDIVDDLTKITGVTIRAGFNSQDWRVRDIPMLVCVHDLPLERLLQSIAEASHTSLVSEVTGGENRPYRFYRTNKDKHAIEMVTDSKRMLQWSQAEWAWDALVKLGTDPKVAKEMNDKYPQSARNTITVSQIIASLGPDAKEQLFSGEPIKIDSKSARQAGKLSDLCRSAIAGFRKSLAPTLSETDTLEPTQDEIDTATLDIKLAGSDGSGDISLRGSLSPVRVGNMYIGIPFLLCDDAKKLDTLPSLGLPHWPDNDSSWECAYDHLKDQALQRLKTEEDWTAAFLQTKVKLEKPRDNDNPTCADILTLIAESSGVNIICEDFDSHLFSQPIWTQKVFGQEYTLAELFKPQNSTWFVDEKNKLLVGWDGVEGQWLQRHQNLVPEQFLLSLTEEKKGGFELDDLISITGLTKGQKTWWFMLSRDLQWAAWLFDDPDDLWKLYGSLNEQEKALARTEAGVSLARFDAAVLKQTLKAANTRPAILAGQDTKADPAQIDAVFASPDAIRSLVIRLESKPAQTPTSTLRNSPHGKIDIKACEKLLHSYTLEVCASVNGEATVVASSRSRASFPVYGSEESKQFYKQ